MSNNEKLEQILFLSFPFLQQQQQANPRHFGPNYIIVYFFKCIISLQVLLIDFSDKKERQ